MVGSINWSPYLFNDKVLKKGEAIPKGCIAEQISCLKPGKVNSAVRKPPPMLIWTLSIKLINLLFEDL
jgi:hypothetical protein